MNNARRKEIERAISLIREAQEIIEFIANEEQEYANNMPENLQQSEKHETAENTAVDLCDSASEIESTADSLSEILNG